MHKIVESVGQGVTEFTVGDHVLTVFIGVCGKCRQCTSGKSNICEVLGLERRGVMRCDQRTRFCINGEPIYHYCAVSSFSEYTVVHSGCAVKISSVVPLEKVAQGAKLRGTSQIIGVDTNPEKGENAKAFGITAFINPRDSKDPIQQIITLKGSLFGGWKPKSDLPSLVDMYTKKEIQVEEYITHNLPFEDVNKAFNLMREGKCLRCVIHMAK
ncbi:GroES-like zinc-binding dehydrogenase family protein [Prunus dulcis]|uniref:GroES-like zinc-binding dehydrogenase family protein n=1 Tax=Prunus dulcis TaxID=3755 RepID=A0A4Y1RKG9_PRUDU|nr:GroES-like zinc-binding dehydrogenase family protein [Prunus dulcis]